ncbi:MAG: virion core protein, partial [Clostridia bacterium]|nr:virion core protein [Clostridia bacterium]
TAPSLAEFLEALQTSMNQMSVNGIRISHVVSKGSELRTYLSDALDEKWKKMRGFEIQSVGIASITYDEESKELINMRNKGAMLGDPGVREGYVQGSVARGMEAAGSNAAGSAAAFMGMGIGMQAGGGFMGTASAANQQQMQRETQQTRPAGAPPVSAADGQWQCTCGALNSSKFCSECGQKKPEGVKCAHCSYEITGSKPKFCPECGKPID